MDKNRTILLLLALLLISIVVRRVVVRNGASSEECYIDNLDTLNHKKDKSNHNKINIDSLKQTQKYKEVMNF